VAAPLLLSRMKEGNEATGYRINRRQISPFEPVAERACLGKILNSCLAAVFFGTDMVCFKWQVGVIPMQ
jgi:hypothetical protein